MSYPLRVFAEDPGNPNISSWVGTAASCSPVHRLPSCCIAAQLSPTSLLLHAHLHDPANVYQAQAVVPANIFQPNSNSSRKDSFSVDSVDDISMNGSEFDLSLEEDEGSEKELKITRRSLAKSGSTDSPLSDLSLKDSPERHGRRRKPTTESNARYRLECIRERNRLAARKYRLKQKDRSSKLETDGEKLQEERDDLAKQVVSLQKELLLLKQRNFSQACWNCGSPC